MTKDMLKSFPQFINESEEWDEDRLRSAEVAALRDLAAMGLATDETRCMLIQRELAGLLKESGWLQHSPAGLEFDEGEITEEIDESRLSELVWADWQDSSALDILELTGNLWIFRDTIGVDEDEDEENAELQMEYFYGSIGISAGSFLVKPDGRVRVMGDFWDSSGNDNGFNQLLRDGGYPLEKLVGSDSERLAILKEILEVAERELVDGTDASPE
jgi:hypothetical protein